MVSTPLGLVYGKVVGRFLVNLADGVDSDDMPEFVALSGTVTFKADPPKVLAPLATPDPATIVPLPDYYTATLDSSGYITSQGARGIRLIAPTSGTTNPAGWSWRVSFDLFYGTVRVPITPYHFHVTPYTPGTDPTHPDVGSTGLTDLTKVSPVPGSLGDAVTQGASVVGVSLVGDALVFALDSGVSLAPVTVPQISAAIAAATAAAGSATAAAGSATAAAAAVNSFSVAIGTVTTLPVGSPAAAAVHGGPPAWTVDLGLPTGATGSGAPDATSSVKGLVQLPGVIPGELGGTAAHPAVTGWSGKSDVGHTHTSAAITDATATGISVLTAASQAAARTAIGAGTSSLAIGTSGTTAAAGNDSRLSDTRTPATGTVPYDLAIIVCGKDTVRAVGSGDNPFGVKLKRAITVTEITVRAITADGSGSLTVELRQNGTAPSGANIAVAFGSQVAGGTTTGTWSFSAGDLLLPYITAIGGTPGKGLIVELKALA